MKDLFSEYYQNNFWKDDESVSGHGSNMEQTRLIREKLPELFNHLDIRTVLDIPCGDFNWFSEIELANITYIGADVVPELIADNLKKYTMPLSARYFEVLDITKDELPKVDLVLCRDLLGHFSRRDVRLALRNLRASGSRYLLATTFPDHVTEGDIRTGEWRPINLASMYGLPDPSHLINEGCTEGGGEFADKSLGLWDLWASYGG